MTDPLVPPDVDIQDFAYMPLDVRRMRDSDLAALESPEACWAAVLLWAASWHQVPAASLPDDDRVLSNLAGYGRGVKDWKRVRDGALRGWVKCSDGRLYHPVVAEKALEAWNAKLHQRWKTECARIKKHNDRHGTAIKMPSYEAWVSSGCPCGNLLSVSISPEPVPRDNERCPEGHSRDVPEKIINCPEPVPRETHSKGEGEGKGYVNPRLQDAITDSTVVTPAWSVCVRLRREARMADANSGHPKLLALLEAGLTEDEIVSAGVDAVAKGKGFAYALATAENRRREAGNVTALPAAKAQPKRDNPFAGAI